MLNTGIGNFPMPVFLFVCFFRKALTVSFERDHRSYIKIKLKNIKSSWNNVIPRAKTFCYLEKMLNIVFIISLFSLNMYINF